MNEDHRGCHPRVSLARIIKAITPPPRIVDEKEGMQQGSLDKEDRRSKEVQLDLTVEVGEKPEEGLPTDGQQAVCHSIENYRCTPWQRSRVRAEEMSREELPPRQRSPRCDREGEL